MLTSRKKADYKVILDSKKINNRKWCDSRVIRNGFGGQNDEKWRTTDNSAKLPCNNIVFYIKKCFHKITLFMFRQLN